MYLSQPQKYKTSLYSVEAGSKYSYFFIQIFPLEYSKDLLNIIYTNTYIYVHLYLELLNSVIISLHVGSMEDHIRELCKLSLQRIDALCAKEECGLNDCGLYYFAWTEIGNKTFKNVFIIAYNL